jgi:hypothetical protein
MRLGVMLPGHGLGLFGCGPWWPIPVERSNPIFTIFEGTSGIQRLIIGRAVSGLDVR